MVQHSKPTANSRGGCLAVDIALPTGTATQAKTDNSVPLGWRHRDLCFSNPSLVPGEYKCGHGASRSFAWGILYGLLNPASAVPLLLPAIERHLGMSRSLGLPVYIPFGHRQPQDLKYERSAQP